MFTRTRLSVDRPVDRPFHQSTGQSTGCPTESWVLSVGRPIGRPSFNLCTLCTSGRPGRSTGEPVLLLLLFFCCCSLRLRRRLPRRSLDDPSTILINFPISKLSLSNISTTWRLQTRRFRSSIFETLLARTAHE